MHIRRSAAASASILVLSLFSMAPGGTPALAAPSCGGALGECPGHFLCYTVKPAKAPKGAPAFPRFVPQTLALTDRLGGPLPFDLKKTIGLCNPANKNGEDPGAPSRMAHLLGYQGKRAKTAPKFDRKGSVFEVRNQLHPAGLILKLAGEDQTLIATSKIVGTGGNDQQPPPGLANFKCYKVALAKAKRGQPPFPKFTPALGVTVVDQFAERLFDLTKPTRACHPLLISGETAAANDAPAHLVCYRAKFSKLRKQDKIPKQRVSTRNALGEEILESATAQELCVPSVVTPSVADMIRTFDDADVQTRLVHENSPELLRPGAEFYYPEVGVLIEKGPAAVSDILARFAGTATLADDVPLLVLAYVLEKIGDPSAVPVLVDWLERNLFSELVWATEFVTHTIKVLDGQAGLDTLTFTYTINEKLDTIAQARGSSTTATSLAFAPAEPRAADTDIAVCDQVIIVRGFNPEGQEQEVELKYKVANRDIGQIIADETNEARRKVFVRTRDQWRSGDEVSYGGTDYVPLPGEDVSVKSNCAGVVIENTLNDILSRQGSLLTLRQGQSDATQIRDLAKLFGNEVGLFEVDRATVVSHERDTGSAAHVEVPIATTSENEVTVLSKDNYGIPRTHTIFRDGSVNGQFAPARKAYEQRSWGFSDLTTRFYRIDIGRIRSIAVDSSACDCVPNAPGNVPVVITAPTAMETAERVIVVSGTVGNPYVTSATLRVNGSPQQIEVVGGAFSTQIVLQSGPNFLFVSVDAPDGTRGCAAQVIKSNAAKSTISATLTWNLAGADVDLYVTQPDGETAYFSHRITGIGGELDVDNIGGLGPENYFLSTEQGDQAPPGPYTIRVHYYDDARDDAEHPTRTVTWRLVVVQNEGPQQTRSIHSGVLFKANSSNGSPGGSGPDWATATVVTIPEP